MEDYPVPGGRIITPGDPHWRGTVFMLKPDDTGGSTSFTESSLFKHTLTNSGSTPKVADNMFLPDGRFVTFSGSQRLSVTNTVFSLGLSDFTIEFWVNLMSGSTQYARILAIGPNATAGSLFINRHAGNPGYLIELGNGSGYDGCTSNNSSFPYGRWVHFALVREESSPRPRWRVYINGNQTSSSTGYADRNLTRTELTIGGNTSGGETFQGSLADIRITRGVARYTDNFIPPRFHPTV